MRGIARLIALGILLTTLLAAMPVGAAAESGTVRASLTVDGRERTYLVHTPPGYDGAGPLPLVLLLHGAGGDGAGMERLSGFDAVADMRNVIAVYPDGVGRRWADGRGFTAAEQTGVDDVAFIGALLDQVAARYAVDASRVYVAGISNGGFMTGRLACDLPDRFAAVGIVASAVTVPVSQMCAAERAMPVIFMHGTDDPLVPATGGNAGAGQGAFLSTADSVAFWVHRNGCTTPPVSTDLPAPVPDGTQIREDTYTGCNDGADVTYDEMRGAGHIWPGGPQYLPVRFIGKTTGNLDGSAALWDFFAAHPKP